MKKFLPFLAAVLLIPAAAHSATLVWGASNAQRNYFVMPDGTTYVPNDSLVRLGWFDSDYDIFGSDNSLKIDIMSPAGRAIIEDKFNQLDTGRTGNFLGRAGSLADSVDIGNSDVQGLAGKQLVMLAYVSTDNSSVGQSLATLTHFGAFFLNVSNASNWAIPSDGATSAQTTIDIGELNGPLATAQGGKTAELIAGAEIPVGRYSNVNELNADSARGFALAVVPEPSTAGLALLGGIALLARRRRVS
jgi:hypothetical protein